MLTLRFTREEDVLDSDIDAIEVDPPMCRIDRDF
jgi:hypothetical protein